MSSLVIPAFIWHSAPSFSTSAACVSYDLSRLYTGSDKGIICIWTFNIKKARYNLQSLHNGLTLVSNCLYRIAMPCIVLSWVVFVMWWWCCIVVGLILVGAGQVGASVGIVGGRLANHSPRAWQVSEWDTRCPHRRCLWWDRLYLELQRRPVPRHQISRYAPTDWPTNKGQTPPIHMSRYLGHQNPTTDIVDFVFFCFSP